MNNFGYNIEQLGNNSYYHTIMYEVNLDDANRAVFLLTKSGMNNLRITPL